MSETTFDLVAGLATKRTRQGDRNKYYIEIETKGLPLTLDEQKIAEPFARAIAAEMTRALIAGVKMDGTPMPAPQPSTVERREYRDKQEISIERVRTRRMKAEGRHGTRAAGYGAKTKRSGATEWTKYSATQSQIDEATRQGSLMAARAAKTGGDTEMAFRSGQQHALEKARKAARNYKRRFFALKLGRWDPRYVSNLHPVGVESGLLANSIRCDPKPPGFAVYVTDRRSFIDETGDSPAKRVFARTGFLRGLLQNRAVQQAARQSISLVLLKKATQALAHLKQTYQRAAALQEEMSSIGESEGT